MTTWFTSDPHYYHGNVIEYCKRPFKDANGNFLIEEMNEKLIQNWNAVVRPGDTVYCLGDFSLAIRPVELYSSRLMGDKKLVPGNHDWCHPANKKARGNTEHGTPKLDKWIKKYEEHGWTVLPIQTELDLEGVAKVNVCHMPYKGDTTDDRYQNYRMLDDGRVLLCGHVHEKWKVKRTPKGTIMINVGVDVWDLKPVSQDTIQKLILDLQSQSSNSSLSLENS